MDFTELLQQRRAIRDFTDQPLTTEHLKTIVQAAQEAPSWGDSQPWHVTIATGQTLAKIKAAHLDRVQRGITGHAELTPTHRNEWTDVPRTNMAAFTAAWQPYSTAPTTMTTVQGQLFNAPALVYLTVPKTSSDWSFYDLGAFGQTLMLAAANSGIDSMPAYEIVKYPDLLRQFLPIGDDQLIAMGIALGYRSDAKLNQLHAPRPNVDTILTLKN